MKDSKRKLLPKGTLSLIVLALFSLFFTAFVILNAYEQLFFKDIPYLETLREYKHTNELSTIVSRTDNTAEFLHHLVRDIPRYITIPSINTSVELTAALFRDNTYFVRGNKGHVITKANSNTLIIYLDENWRTTTALSTLQKDDLLFILSYDYNYIFKIEHTYASVDDFQKKVEDNLKPEIVLVGSGKETFSIITATLVNSVHR